MNRVVLVLKNGERKTLNRDQIMELMCDPEKMAQEGGCYDCCRHHLETLTFSELMDNFSDYVDMKVEEYHILEENNSNVEEYLMKQMGKYTNLLSKIVIERTR